VALSINNYQHLYPFKDLLMQSLRIVTKSSVLAALAILLSLGLSACGGGGGGSSSASTTPSGAATSNYTLPTAISAVPPQK
jgi:phage-related minor tail protein